MICTRPLPCPCQSLLSCWIPDTVPCYSLCLNHVFFQDKLPKAWAAKFSTKWPTLAQGQPTFNLAWNLWPVGPVRKKKWTRPESLCDSPAWTRRHEKEMTKRVVRVITESHQGELKQESLPHAVLKLQLWGSRVVRDRMDRGRSQSHDLRSIHKLQVMKSLTLSVHFFSRGPL